MYLQPDKFLDIILENDSTITYVTRAINIFFEQVILGNIKQIPVKVDELSLEKYKRGYLRIDLIIDNYNLFIAFDGEDYIINIYPLNVKETIHYPHTELYSFIKQISN